MPAEPADAGPRCFILIPGAGGAAYYWHRVLPLLRKAGHEAIAVDLPGDDEAAGLPEYARLVADTMAGRRPLPATWSGASSYSSGSVLTIRVAPIAERLRLRRVADIFPLSNYALRMKAH